MANGADKPHYEDNCCGVGLHQHITVNIWAGKTDLKTSKMAILKFICPAPEWNMIIPGDSTLWADPKYAKKFCGRHLTSAPVLLKIRNSVQFQFQFNFWFGILWIRKFGILRWHAKIYLWNDSRKSKMCTKWVEEKGEAQSRSGNYNLVYFESH